MKQLTRQAFGKWMGALLHVHDTPQRTAAAFALGVTLGFSPFVGLHTVVGLALAFLFNLNRVAVLAGLWVNLPWFMAPYYAATTALGTWITGTPMPPEFLNQLQDIWDLPSWRDRMAAVGHLLRPLLVPFILGSTLVAVPLGLVAYRATLAFLLARRRHHQPVNPPEGGHKLFK
jgi:uncharacterized protein (DUF2062 family)